MRAITDDTRANILKEQFIPDHVFIYVVKGAVRIFDGNKNYVFREGDAVIARKNRLAKYELTDSNNVFEPVLFCFEQSFLEAYQKKHSALKSIANTTDSFIAIRKNAMISSLFNPSNLTIRE